MADTVDSLIEKYLNLLDDYSQLQEQLASAQKNMFHHLARANWTARNGVRYGPDFYDERMKAIRCVEETMRVEGGAKFAVVEVALPEAEAEAEAEEDKAEEGETDGEAGKGETEGADEAESKEPEKPRIDLRNPIRWFGLLAPPDLRMAQAQAILTVDSLVPQLINVRADIRQAEIEIARARKQRAKTEKELAKTENELAKKDVAGVTAAVETMALAQSS